MAAEVVAMNQRLKIAWQAWPWAHEPNKSI